MGTDGVKLSKSDWGKMLNGVKNTDLQVTYFLNGLMLICSFIVILLYIEKKWLLMRNLTTVENCIENFSILDGTIKMLKNG